MNFYSVYIIYIEMKAMLVEFDIKKDRHPSRTLIIALTNHSTFG